MKTKHVVAGFAALLAAALYAAWPFWSARQLREAMVSGDVAVLARKIDWPQLRASVKAMLSAEMMRVAAKETAGRKSGQDDGANLASGFMMLFGPMVVERMVESIVTPEGLATMAAQSASEAGSKPRFDAKTVKRVRLVGPFRLEFELGEAESTHSNLLGAMELRDFEWKLTQVVALRPLESWYVPPASESAAPTPAAPKPSSHWSLPPKPAELPAAVRR
jgi:hypothetical protein